MDSREKMLTAIRANQPETSALPEIEVFDTSGWDLLERFQRVLESIGGQSVIVKSYDEIKTFVALNFADADRIVSSVPELGYEKIDVANDPHLLQNIELAVLRGHFGVAENSAIWVTEETLGERVLPFICQYLALVIRKEDIVPTMHQAYERIGQADYGFGGFIAGPSKTADIEQSLVLGAHGPKGMTAFILDGNF